MHVPLRTCLISGQKLPQSKLLRLIKAKQNDGNFTVGTSKDHKSSGKSIYLTPNIETFELALKKGIIESRLRLNRKLSSIEIEAIKKSLNSITT